MTTLLSISIDGVEMLRVPWWMVRPQPKLLGGVLLDLPSTMPLLEDGTAVTDIKAIGAGCRLSFRVGSGIGDMPIGCQGWGPGNRITIELMKDGQ